MINCKYTGTKEVYGHPYLIGMSGKCSEDSAELLKKYFIIKSKRSNHDNHCECQKCRDIYKLGNTIVIYSAKVNNSSELEEYRVFLKNLELVYE